jgi:hypothetical protein
MVMFVLVNLVLIAAILFRSQLQKNQKLKQDLTTHNPKLARALDQQLAMLENESFEQSVANLPDVNLFYWPGPLNLASGLGYGMGSGMVVVVQYVPLPKEAGQSDIDAVFSNRRFRKILDELRQMDKLAATQTINRELSKLTDSYLKLYDAELQSKSPDFTIEKIQGKTDIPGLAFVDNTHGEIVISGLRLGVLSLVWLAGQLGLPDCKLAVERVARIALKQRNQLYGDPALHRFFKNQMLYMASLYNRQILSTGLLGTAVGVDVNSLEKAVGIEWQERKLVSYRAVLTEYDLPVRSGMMKADDSLGATTVRFVSPLDDGQFDALLASLHLNL